MRVSPRENSKCNACEFLPRRNATHASFSPGEMGHVRVSPRGKCDTCQFLPRRNATHVSFSPGEMRHMRVSPRANFKRNACELLPRRKATHVSFSPGEMRYMRVSPREKRNVCDNSEYLAFANESVSDSPPGNLDSIKCWLKLKN
jgi:hypothetical protein